MVGEIEELEVCEGVDCEIVEIVVNMGFYKYGWDIEIEMEYVFKGLNEDIVWLILVKNDEFEWMIEWCLQVFCCWLIMIELKWVMVNYFEIDFQDQYYYVCFKSMEVKLKLLDEVDFKLLVIYEKLGILLKEQMIFVGVEGVENVFVEGCKVVVDVVFDSVFVGMIFKDELVKVGVIFCLISEVICEYFELVQKYLGSVVL